MRYRFQLSFARALAAAILGLALAGGPAKAQDLTIYAAASLGGAMEDIADAWLARTGGRLTLVHAGSSSLAWQIQSGAPADMAIFANSVWMDALENSGHVAPRDRVDLLTNRLVVIGGWHETDPLDLTEPGSLAARLGSGRLALGLVDAVPVGIYAREALENLGHWSEVEEAVVQSDNARTTLALVALRAADLGVVYATDARVERRVAVIAEVPAESHAPIRYPAAGLVGGDLHWARQFLEFLQTPIARAVFSGHGFGLAEGR